MIFLSRSHQLQPVVFFVVSRASGNLDHRRASNRPGIHVENALVFVWRDGTNHENYESLIWALRDYRVRLPFRPIFTALGLTNTVTWGGGGNGYGTRSLNSIEVW